MKAPPDATRTACSITWCIPWRSMSYMLNTVTPARRRCSRSPSSMLRTPTSTACSPSTEGIGQASLLKRWSSDSPSVTASGIPCTFPLGELTGVLMSEWASTQTTPPGAPWARANPPSVPIAIEWSPPSTSGTSPAVTTSATSRASSSQVCLMESQ